MKKYNTREPNMFSSSVDMIKKLLVLSQGYGEQSIQLCYDTISESVLKSGTSLSFKIFSSDVVEEKTKIQQEKSPANPEEQVVSSIEIDDVKKKSPDSLSLFNDLMKTEEETYGGKLKAEKKFELWTNIRLAYGFYSPETRKRLLICRLYALASYLTIEKELPVDLFKRQPLLIKELRECLEKDEAGLVKLPKDVAIAIFDLYSSFALLPKKSQMTSLQSLIVTGSSTFSGVLQKLVSKITKKFLQDSDSTEGEDLLDDRDYLDAIFNLLISISRTLIGVQILHESGLAVEIVNLLQSKSDYVVMKCICMVELFVSQKTRSVPQQHSAIADCVKIFMDLVELSLPKIRDLEQQSQQRDASSNANTFEIFNVYQAPTFASALRILNISIQNPEFNVTELLEAKNLSNINSVLKHHLWFGPSNFSVMVTLMASLIGREPSQIPNIRNSGTLDILIEIFKNGVPASMSFITTIPPLLTAFSLNNECLERIDNENILELFYDVLTEEKYAKSLSKEAAVVLGRDINDYIRNYPTKREKCLDMTIKFVKKVIQKLDEVASDSEEMNEKRKSRLHTAHNLLAVVGMVTVGRDNITMFIEKDGLNLVTTLLEKSMVPLLSAKDEGLSMGKTASAFVHMGKVDSAKVFDALSDLLIRKLDIVKGDVDIDQPVHLAAVYSITRVLQIMIRIFREPDEPFIKSWRSKGKDILLPMARLDSKLLFLHTKKSHQRTLESISQLKKKANKTTEEGTTEKAVIEESAEEIASRAKRNHVLSVIDGYSVLIKSLYASLQKAIFNIVKTMSAEAIREAKEVALVLAENLIVPFQVFDTVEGTWQEKCTTLESMISDLYRCFISNQFKNLNSIVLDTLNEKGVIDLVLEKYVQMVDTILKQDIVYQEDAKLEEIQALERSLADDSIAKRFLVSATLFLQRICSQNYIATSPVTTNMVMAPGNTFDASVLAKNIQKKVAAAILKFWKNPGMDRVSDAFLTTLINTVGHIVKGSMDAKEPSTPGGEGKKDTNISTEDESGVNQLIDMGFSERHSRAAMRKASNNIMVAMEWILNNPEEEPQEEAMEDDEDELSKAIKLSMMESGIEEGGQAVEEVDHVSVLEEQLSDWLLSKVYVPSLTFPCIDVLSLLIKKNESLKDRLIFTVIEKLKEEVSQCKSFVSLNVMKNILDYNEEMKSTLLAKKEEYMGLLLNAGEQITEKSDLSLSLFSVFGSLTKSKKLKEVFPEKKKQKLEEKVTVDSLAEQLKVCALVDSETVKIMELCCKFIAKEELLSPQLLRAILNILVNFTIQNNDVAVKLLEYNFIENILATKRKHSCDEFAVLTLQLIKNIIDDDAHIRKSFTHQIQSRFNLLTATGRNVSIQLFLSTFDKFIEKNPKVFFEIVKDLFHIRSGSRFVELKTKNSSDKNNSQQPGSIVVEPMQDDNKLVNNILLTLLNHLVDAPHSYSTVAKDSSDESAFLKSDLLEMISNIMTCYDCYDTVLQFEHEQLYSSMSGENKFLHYVITEILSHVATQSLKSLPSTSSLRILSDVCNKKPNLVFSEIASTLSGDVKFNVLRGIADFLQRMLLASQVAADANVKTQLVALLTKYDIIRMLANCSNKLELSHPMAPMAVTLVCRVLELFFKLAGAAKKQSDEEVTSLNIDLLNVEIQQPQFTSSPFSRNPYEVILARERRFR